MKQGEVWNVNFNPPTGQEIGKTRPAIIVNHDAVGKLHLKIVVPITEPTHVAEWHTPLLPSKGNGLSKKSVADCFQLKSISQDRFISKRGNLSEEEMQQVKLTLMKVLDLL